MFGIKLSLERIITYGAILGLVFFLLLQRGCYKQREARLVSSLDSTTLANQKLDSIKNKLGQTVYEQEAIITNNQQELKQLADEKFALTKKQERQIKEITFYYESKLKIKVDSLFIPYEDITQLRKFKDSADFYRFAKDSMIAVPKFVRLSDSSQHYKNGLRFEGIVQKVGFNINEVSFIDTQYIRINKIKRNLWQSITFKPRKYEIQVLHTSPYMEVQGQTSIIYQEAKKANLLWQIIKAGGLIYLGSRL